MSHSPHGDEEASSAGGLGPYLKRIRESKNLTQRQVEEASKALDEEFEPVSNAYLSQLETDKVTDPSPRILRTLAHLYGVPYRAVMMKANYLRLEDTKSEGGRLATFADHGLTPEEEAEALQYILIKRRLSEGGA